MVSIIANEPGLFSKPIWQVRRYAEGGADATGEVVAKGMTLREACDFCAQPDNLPGFLNIASGAPCVPGNPHFGLV